MTRFHRVFVWGGGALFVASLVVWLWWFLIELGTATPWRGWAPLAFDALLFTLFALHHSVFAREPIKRRLTAIPPGLRRSVYVWIASVLLLIVCLAWRRIGGDLYAARGVVGTALVGVQLTGIWLVVRSVAKIDPLELAGIRAATSMASLQIEGPYRLVRHPLYLGWMFVVFAAPHMTGDRFAFAAISSIYLLAAVPWEERSLRLSFGDAYARYEREVRWRVIPFVY